MKLDINKSYTIYTLSDFIVNKQVRILGYINYDRASQYRSFVENVAINEKFIDNSISDTVEYLKSQIYYDCCVIKNVNNTYELTDEHIILWDDIIDTTRTERLFEDYQFDFSFKFKNIESTDVITKEKVIAYISECLEKMYNSKNTKVDFTFTEKVKDTENTDAKIKKLNSVIEEANDTLLAFVNLQDTAKKITSDFIDNQINEKINNISNNLVSIKSSTDNIIANLK